MVRTVAKVTVEGQKMDILLNRKADVKGYYRDLHHGPVSELSGLVVWQPSHSSILTVRIISIIFHSDNNQSISKSST